MNRTELIEKIIRRLGYDSVTPHDTVRIKQILEEELPDFQRIDEEGMEELYELTYTKDWDCSTVKLMMEKYNSTLPPALVLLPKEMPALWHNALTDLLHNRMQPSEFYLLIRKTYGTPANNLQPLPKEVPEWFHGGHNFYKLWSLVCHNYGTPEPKRDLPTVEELAKEIAGISVPIVADKKLSRVTAEYIIDKYSLPTREWWQELNRGDQFIYKCGDGTPKRVGEGLGIQADDGKIYHVDNCYPYTTPSAQDIIAKHNLSEEEVKAIREGK